MVEMTLARTAITLWNWRSIELRAAGIPSAFRVFLDLQHREGITRIADILDVRFRVQRSATHQEIIGGSGVEIVISTPP